ncbi:carbohydrate ABC transporter permease [Devosia sp.]|uniref:carbohydrate ABC transporter permease n=1 Tax=Devosia sp. TaxID=1871048 RepID=UPI003A8EEF67
MTIASPKQEQPRRWLRGGMRIRMFAYALVAPVTLLILGLVAYPFGFAIWVSFTDQVIGSVGQFIGFANFEYLAQRATFWSAIWNTIFIVVVTDTLKLLIGLGLALLVHQNLPGRGIFRSLLLLPWAMPAFVAFLTWRVLYQPIGGGINLVLTQTGIYSGIIDWLGTKNTAMASVIIATVWRGFPFWFISILAALQAVPKDLYEAATIDGANAWQKFWAVTAPGIRQVVIVTVLLSSIWTANGFEHVWLLTQGGPSDATMVFPVLAYFGMQTQRIGEAAAVSVYMLPVLAILVVFATSLMLRDED